MNICVYAASSDALDPAYYSIARTLGSLLALGGHRLVYGGGAGGLMGACARGVIEHGGEAHGVAPRFFNAPGVLFFDGCSILLTETMAQRKTYMAEKADAFIALPGGIGTMEEILEVITLRTLGQTDKPAAFLDCDGYWLPTVEALRMTVDKGFAKPGLMEAFDYFTDAEACLRYLEGKRHDL